MIQLLFRYVRCNMMESSGESSLPLPLSLWSQTFYGGDNTVLFVVQKKKKRTRGFPRLHQANAGATIKTSSSLDVVTLRYCSISVMARLPSIFALLSRFRTQKSNYGLLYIKALICYCGEGQRASFVCSLHSSQRSAQRSALHFSTFTSVHLNIYRC